MKKAYVMITIVIALFLLLAVLQVTGALAAEVTTTPTRTMRATLPPTSTPAPFTATPYPGPDEDIYPIKSPTLKPTSTATVPPSDVGVITFGGYSNFWPVIRALVVFLVLVIVACLVAFWFIERDVS